MPMICLHAWCGHPIIVYSRVLDLLSFIHSPLWVCGSKSRPRNTLHLYFRAPVPTQARVYLLRPDNRVYEKWAAWTLYFPKHIPAPSSTTRKHRSPWSVGGYKALTLQKQSRFVGSINAKPAVALITQVKRLNLKRTDGFDDDDVLRPKGLLFLPFFFLPWKKTRSLLHRVEHTVLGG